jgi:Ca-activated chloride channel family protein
VNWFDGSQYLAAERLWFLLLVPALIAMYVVLQRRKSRVAVRFTNVALIDTVVKRQVNWVQHTAVVLALMTLAFGIMLFARPTKDIKVPLNLDSEVTVVLTLDVSLSMSATDVDPDRITAAKETAKEFIDKLPPNFKVGVVSFSKVANVEIPPTKDHQAAISSIEALKLSEYTATGEGIYTALSVIEQDLAASGNDKADKPPAFMVLISDGARTIGRSQVGAAQAAKDARIPIYTVALGTPDATITSGGRTIPVPVEIPQLEEVARISGGKSYVAETPNDLVKAYSSVDSQIRFLTERGDATSEYMGYLVLLALLSTGAGLSVAARWP